MDKSEKLYRQLNLSDEEIVNARNFRRKIIGLILICLVLVVVSLSISLYLYSHDDKPVKEVKLSPEIYGEDDFRRFFADTFRWMFRRGS